MPLLLRRGGTRQRDGEVIKEGITILPSILARPLQTGIEDQYGKNIAALLAELNTVGAVSTDRVKEIAGSIVGLPIVKGTIISMVSRCTDKLKGFLCTVKNGILQSREVNFDETGSSVEKKTGWVYCAVTQEYTYLFFHEKRGTEAIDDMGILPLFKGIVHHVKPENQVLQIRKTAIIIQRLTTITLKIRRIKDKIIIVCSPGIELSEKIIVISGKEKLIQFFLKRITGLYEKEMKKSNFVKCMFLLLAICSLNGCGRKEINLNDYVKCSFNGYDRLGKANSEIDFDAIVEENYSSFKLKKNYNASDKADVVFKLEEKISAEPDKTEDLRNDDVVSVAWNNPDKIKELETIYKVKLNYSDVQFTVDGLTELIEVNPFDYTTVAFEGMDGEGRAVAVQVSDEDEMNVYFSYDKDSNLTNGDQINVSLKHCNIKGKQVNKTSPDSIAEYGYYFTENEKLITVEGLPHYATSISEIPEDALNEKIEYLKEHVSSVFTKERSGIFCTADNVELAALYLLSEKPDHKTRYHNVLYYVFKVDITTNALKMPETLYYAGNCEDIIINTDGTCSELGWKNTVRCNASHSTFIESWLSSLDSFEKSEFRETELEKNNLEKKIY